MFIKCKFVFNIHHSGDDDDDNNNNDGFSRYNKKEVKPLCVNKVECKD